MTKNYVFFCVHYYSYSKSEYKKRELIFKYDKENEKPFVMTSYVYLPFIMLLVLPILVFFR